MINSDQPNKDNKDNPMFMMTEKLDKIRELNDQLDELDVVEQTRKEREKYLLLNAIADMVLVYDDEGIIKYANPSSYSVLSYDPTDLVGRHIDELIGPHSVEVGLNTSMDIIANNANGTAVPVHFYVGEIKEVDLHLYISTLRKVNTNASQPNLRGT